MERCQNYERRSVIDRMLQFFTSTGTFHMTDYESAMVYGDLPEHRRPDAVAMPAANYLEACRKLARLRTID
jgi:hypothetical protein